MKKNKNIILLAFWVFLGCQNPSSPSVSLINRVHVEYTNNDALDVDVDDNHIVLAASDDGYYKFSYAIENDLPIITSIEADDEYDTNFDNNHDDNFGDDSFDKVILSSNNGFVYLLDKGTSGGSAGIWIDNVNGNEMEVGYYSDNCYQSKYVDIAIDDNSVPGTYELVEGIPETAVGTDFSHTIYALLKHTNLGGLVTYACADGSICNPEFPTCLDNSDCAPVIENFCSNDGTPCNSSNDCTDGASCNPESIDIMQYSSSIVKRKIDFVCNLEDGEEECAVDNTIQFFDGGCELIYSGLGYHSKDIDFNNNVIAIANKSEGIKVFENNDQDDLEITLEFNVPGAEAQSVHMLSDAVIGGFSTSSGGSGGCYMALLDSSPENQEIYDTVFAEGYSVRSIDSDGDLIGLATGSKGVQIYQRSIGSDIVIPYVSIDSEYAYDVKIKNNFVFIATNSGLEVYKIGS